jgi:iron(III) transport system permease protein
MENTLKSKINIPDLVIKLLLIWFIAAFLIYPNINMVVRILYKDGSITLDVFRRLFSSGRAIKAIGNSFILAVSMVVTVNAVGTILVLFTEYIDIKGARFLKICYMTPLVYGGIVLCNGYKFIYGSNGIITNLMASFFTGMNKNWFTGYGAVIFIMTFACTSNHLIFLTNAIRGIDYQTIEAARNLGASPGRILLKVVMPVLLPTLFAITILTFLTGLGAMSAPLVVGGVDFQTISPLIIDFSRAPYSQDLAALMSIILGLSTMILIILFNKFEHKGHYISISKVTSRIKKLKIHNPVINAALHAVAWFFFLIYAVPIVLVVLYSFSNSRAILSGTLRLSDFTIANYVYLLTKADAYRPFGVSIFYSAVSAVIVAALAIVVSRILHKGKDKFTPLLEYGMLIPWMLPSTMIALGLITTFNVRQPIIFNQTLIGTIYFLLVGYIIAKIPFSLRMIKAAFFSVDKSLEEAARSLGAGAFYTMIRVIMPVILPAVISVIALNFNGFLAEYDITVLLYHPLMQPLGPVIRAASNEEASLNAKAISFVYSTLLIALSSIAFFIIYGKKPKLKRQHPAF